MKQDEKSKLKNQIDDLFIEKQQVSISKKSHIISIVSNKGGTGKTNVSNCLSAMLAYQGFKVLYVDMDSQNNSRAMIPNKDNKNSTLFDTFKQVYNAKFDLKALAGKIKSPIIPYSEEINNEKTLTFDILSLGEEITSSNVAIINGLNDLCGDYEVKYPLTEYGFFKPILQLLINQKKYDYVIIDTEPSPSSILKRACLVASDYVILVAEPTQMGWDGVLSAAKMIENIKKINTNLKNLAIVITKYKIGQYCQTTDIAINEILKGIFMLAEKLKIPFVHAYYSTMYNSANIEGMQFSPLVRSIKRHKSSIFEDYKLITKTILGQIQLLEK
jgi:chromosome partitioning protein